MLKRRWMFMVIREVWRERSLMIEHLLSDGASEPVPKKTLRGRYGLSKSQPAASLYRCPIAVGTSHFEDLWVAPGDWRTRLEEPVPSRSAWERRGRIRPVMKSSAAAWGGDEEREWHSSVGALTSETSEGAAAATTGSTSSQLVPNGMLAQRGRHEKKGQRTRTKVCFFLGRRSYTSRV